MHVGVPSRDLGVQVLARLRPWLASLLAITVNSPIADGRDTAWASSRYLAWSRWPTARPPAVWPDAAAYDAAVRGLIGRGAALDERGIYLLARLSPRPPSRDGIIRWRVCHPWSCPSSLAACHVRSPSPEPGPEPGARRAAAGGVTPLGVLVDGQADMASARYARG